MHLWSFLSQRFQQHSSFTHPHEYEELYFQLCKFVHGSCNYIRIRQIQIDILQELRNDLSSMRLEVENGGMPYPSPQLSNFEPHYISTLIAAFHKFHQINHWIHSIPCKLLGNMSDPIFVSVFILSYPL